MATIPNTTDPLAEAIQNLNNSDKLTDQTPQNMEGLNVSYGMSNKWWGYFPISNVLGKNYSNLELNLRRFSIPQMVMGSTTTQFKGYTFEFPTRLIDSETKEITIEYLIDEKWQNYRMMYKWCAAYEGQLNNVISTDDVENISLTDLIPCRIYLLDHFKNNIISFTFENCWIKNFGDLALESDNPNEVTHSCTLAYSWFRIDDLQ